MHARGSCDAYIEDHVMSIGYQCIKYDHTLRMKGHTPLADCPYHHGWLALTGI